jgi:UDP-2,4-diacetamido-2,4,6-trideoxy-beta-L-altropyranose hydrolase
MRVLFRVDASRSIGYGHLHRCLSLANFLRKIGDTCVFVCQSLTGDGMSLIKDNNFGVVKLLSMSKSGNHDFRFDDKLAWPANVLEEDSLAVLKVLKQQQFDWLVIDHYGIDVEWQNRVSNDVKVMVIEDLPMRKHGCQILLDQSYGRSKEVYADLVSDQTKYLMGTQFALIRDEFIKARRHHRSLTATRKISRLFVNFGAVDQFQITPRVVVALLENENLKNTELVVVLGEHSDSLKALQELQVKHGKRINLVVSPPKMASLMRGCDAAVGAGGVSAIERCVIGLPSIIIPMAENQRQMAEGLCAKGAAILCELDFQLDIGLQINPAINELCQIGAIAKLQKQALAACDGMGVQRVANMLQAKKITILIEANSWLEKYANSLRRELRRRGYVVRVVREEAKISSGWLCFILGFQKIISSETLKLNIYNLVVHESDLPKGRGFAPISWQILEGKNAIRMCLLEANDEVDSGDVWLRHTLKIEDHDLSIDWRKRQGLETIKMCLKFVEGFWTLSSRAQKGQPSFYRRRSPRDSELDSKLSLKDQFNLLRVVDNEKYPAFFYHKGKKFIIKIEKDERNDR